MTSAEFEKLVNLHLDGALSPAERRRLDAELAARPDRRERLERAIRLNDACREALFRLAAEQPDLVAISEPQPRRAAPARFRWAAGMAAAVASLAVPAWFIGVQVSQVPEPQAPASVIALSAPTTGRTVSTGTATPVVTRMRPASTLSFSTPTFAPARISAEDLILALQQSQHEVAMLPPGPSLLPSAFPSLEEPALPPASVVPAHRPHVIGSAHLRSAFFGSGQESSRYPLATVRFGW